MRSTSAVTILLFILLSYGSAQITENHSGAPSKRDMLERLHLTNPKPFERYVAPVSGSVNFLFSSSGLEMIGRSHNQNLRSFAEQNGIALSPAPQRKVNSAPRTISPHITSTLQPCNLTRGTTFNLESDMGMSEIGFPVPQNEQSVDFAPGLGNAGADLVVGGSNDYRGLFDSMATASGTVIPDAFGWGFSGTGYYVNRSGGCGADFEGGLPTIFDPVGGQDLFGLGDPVIAIDVTRGNVFAADLRMDRSVTAVGLFRTSLDRLRSETLCPSGTHLTDKTGADTTAKQCWPTSLLIGAADPTSPRGTLVDKPHIRVDERPSGTGAGDVYISWTHFGIGDSSSIMVAACSSNVISTADCSAPVQISGTDLNTQFSNIALLPTGAFTITYVQHNLIFDPANVPFLYEVTDIKHVNCIPRGAPARPICRAPSLVTSESQPVFSHLTNATYRVATYPTHDVRTDAKGRPEEILTWSRCKQNPFLPVGTGLFDEMLICPDGDVVYTTSVLGPDGTVKGWTPISPVNANYGDQIQPWLTVNRQTGNTHILYYSSENDPFHHRLQLMMSTLPSGSAAISAPAIILASPDEPDSDPILGASFIGDYLAIASRGDRTYAHSTMHKLGSYGGRRTLGQDNVLTKFSALP